MRRFIAALTAALLLLSVNAYGVEMNLIYDDIYHYYNEEDITLKINGKKVTTREMPPVILMDRTLVPVREVFETIGADVSWHSKTSQTSISYGGISLLFTTGSRSITMGKSKITIPSSDPAPMIINDKTMVPIRIVADLLGFDVGWDGKTRTVSLTEPDPQSPAPDGEDENKEDNDSDKEEVSDKNDEAQSSVSDGSVRKIGKVTCQKNGSADLIYLEYTSPVKPDVYRYTSPERVVLDFDETRLSSNYFNVSFSDGSIVSSVRCANHDDKARIVLDVSKQPKIEIYRSQTGIVIVATPAGTKYTTKIGDLVNGAIYSPPVITAGEDKPEDDGNDESGEVVKPDGPDGVTSIKPNQSDKEDDEDKGTEKNEDAEKETGNAEDENIFDFSSVVIDAGHGGSDPGAISGKIYEKNINLAIAKKVKSRLEKAGYNVIMTRTSDSYSSLQGRVNTAAKKINGKIPAVFVSIHCNSFDNSASHGTQVYYHPDSKYGTILAKNIYNANVKSTGLAPGQIHDGSHLYVVRKTPQPSALVETAFISNPDDRDYLTSEEGQDAFAQGISEGIIKTIEQMKKG